MNSTLKILIVENDTISALLLTHYFRRLGIENCFMTYFGEEAVRLAEQKKPDVVFMDISLAGAIDGIEAAQKIILRNENTQIAFLTSCDEPKVMERALKLLPAAYFVKPVKLSKIKDLLQAISAGSFSTGRTHDKNYCIARSIEHENK